MKLPSIAQFRQWRAEKKLGPAIERHDLATVRDCLAQGAREIDFILYRDGDRPGERVPAGKFTDPVALAKYVGMRDDGLRLFAEHGMLPATPPRPGSPRT